MYSGYFGLAKLPFSISPDPRYLFLTPQHKEALAKCQYIVNQKGGLAVIYGDIGTGKTTIARHLFQLLKQDPRQAVAMLIPRDAQRVCSQQSDWRKSVLHGSHVCKR